MIINHYGITIDSSIPITGVINCNSVSSESLNDDMFYRSGINLSFENYKRDHEKFCDNDDCIAEDHGIEYENYISENDTYLINYKLNEDDLYSPDISKEYCMVVSDVTIQVTYSKYAKNCNLCSPCFPGQGDLDSIGKYLTYSLPVDYFDEYSNFDTSDIITLQEKE